MPPQKLPSEETLRKLGITSTVTDVNDPPPTADEIAAADNAQQGDNQQANPPETDDAQSQGVAAEETTSQNDPADPNVSAPASVEPPPADVPEATADAPADVPEATADAPADEAPKPRASVPSITDPYAGFSEQTRAEMIAGAEALKKYRAG